MSSQANTRIRNGFLIVVVVIIVLPNLVMMLNLEGKNEFAKPWADDSAPAWSDFESDSKVLQMIKYKEGLEKYYEENFGLRETMFKKYSSFKYHTLNESALPNSVIVGNDGWLFLGNKFADVIDEYTRIKPVTAEKINLISEKISKTKTWLESKNIDFFVVIAPNKHSIYGEHIDLKVEKAPSYTQRIIQGVKEKIGFQILDLTPHLLKRKKEERLYHKTDTHWNGLGAFWGYQGIIAHLKTRHPEVDALDRSQFEATSKVKYIQDLGRMLRLKIKEERLDLTLKVPSPVVELPKELTIPKTYQFKPDHYERRFSNKGKPKKILIFRDSFSSAMVKYFKESFGSCVIVWQHEFDKSIVLKEKPDIVLFEYVERDIDVIEKM